MSWARVHRWFAIALVALLIVWSATGLVFHLKPGWNRAYDQLTAEHQDTLRLDGITSIDSLRARFSSIQRIELFDTAIGPLYRVRTPAGSELIDARTGAPRGPLDVDAGRALAVDAVSRSLERDAYGEVVRASVDDRVVRVEFSGGPVVEVGRVDARISQRGPDTDRIDWLYRIHYLQWSGNRTIDAVLAILGLLLIWAVMIPGIVLFVNRVRARPAR